MENEFDKYSTDYNKLLMQSIDGSMQNSEYFSEYKIATIARRLKGYSIDNVLDFGCGVGRSFEYLSNYFPNAKLFGYDVSTESINIVKKRFPGIGLYSNLEQIDQDNFDCIVAANVFHHIPIEAQIEALSICYSFLKPGGHLFIFEHNPVNPLTRRVFDRCPFDKDAKMIPMGTFFELAKKIGVKPSYFAYTLFFPTKLKIFRPLEKFMTRLPLGAQYFVEFIKK